MLTADLYLIGTPEASVGRGTVRTVSVPVPPPGNFAHLQEWRGDKGPAGVWPPICLGKRLDASEIRGLELSRLTPATGASTAEN
ncbi:hypothetical protein N7510_010670 [Penicillium lagena]|uniref:uncharacterized protein n=1 Tax=Penicillium lagena TaxID=94218 RepID=UPI002540C6A7|nr:uncharacterized protein N7510_010670 [Penicillium lagena]KAJ5601136.1 hypothetical protein N7510_010670 [Penicillium lagena]